MSNDRYAVWIADQIAQHAPGEDANVNAWMRLAESAAALSTGAGLVFGMMMPPNLPRREELREQALAVLKTWVGLLDDGATEQLAEVATRANLPLDLAARRAQHAAARRAQLDARIAASQTLDARFTDLERTILDNPGDRDAYLVLADALQSKGDPRGELIALMVAGETDPAKGKAAERYLDKHREALLGPLAPHQKHGAFTWRRGYIERARLPDADGEDSLTEVLELLLAHPSGRFLNELVIGLDGDAGDNSLQGAIDVIANSMVPSVRKLHLGDFEYPDECEMSWFHVGNLAELWRAVPRLTHLIVQGGGDLAFGAIEHDHLQHFEVRSGGLPAALARAITAAKLPAIRHLEIWYGSEAYGGDASFLDVAPLLARHDLPALRHLGLRNCEFADEICDGIASSRLLRQLEVLDLSMGTLSDVGVEAILQHADAFRHLETLDVSQSWISSAALARLRTLGPTIVDHDQQGDPDDDRYVMVGE